MFFLFLFFTKFIADDKLSYKWKHPFAHFNLHGYIQYVAFKTVTTELIELAFRIHPGVIDTWVL